MKRQNRFLCSDLHLYTGKYVHVCMHACACARTHTHQTNNVIKNFKITLICLKHVESHLLFCRIQTKIQFSGALSTASSEVFKISWGHFHPLTHKGQPRLPNKDHLKKKKKTYWQRSGPACFLRLVFTFQFAQSWERGFCIS